MVKWGWILLAVVSVVLTAGCEGQSGPSALPTLTLIPPTITAIPTDVPSPPTEDPALTSPERLLTAEAPTPAQGADETPADPIAAELVLLAQQQVAQQLGISVRRVRLVSIEPRRWNDSSLSCPQPDATYTPIEVDGYRIEVRAADETFIFHTDFDRVIACETDSNSE